jgi:hypothetical protein
MVTLHLKPRHNPGRTLKIRPRHSKDGRTKCIRATIVMVANKKTRSAPKRLLIPVDMNDPVMDGLPALLHDKKTGTPSFTKGDMSVPPLENSKKRKKKKKRKHRKKTRKATTPLHEYLKSFSIST